ncbi:MAG: PadR family transcriptional regulator [Anaerolineaceae bacterium]|nr:PadR family transcriptional regulator [Anaerolineaceae bacterium]
MSLEFAILGLLSWRSLSGYDLKKLFSDSMVLYWSGNNNQIYRTLIKLYDEDLVTREVQHQESAPSRKIYTTTEKGLNELNEWMVSQPRLPQMKNYFLTQLMWGDYLDNETLQSLISQYEEEIQMMILMKQVNMDERNIFKGRTARERFIWEMILENEIGFYQNEWDWLQKLKKGLVE